MTDERLIPELRVVEAIELEAKEARADQPTAPEPSEAAQLLQAEIAVTRQRLASQVDELAERIKPENIKRQLVSSLRERAFAALDLARNNPVPVAMACGAAVLLLIWRARARHART
jgi:Protein of unknown function (DUF3618)